MSNEQTFGGGEENRRKAFAQQADGPQLTPQETGPPEFDSGKWLSLWPRFRYPRGMPSQTQHLMPEPKTQAAREAYEAFLRSYLAQIERSKEVSLSILVWGPAPTSDSPAARKRVEIGQFLSEEGHNAMFSEQLEAVPVPGNWSAKALEYAQAKVVHLIFILIEDSPGALAEAVDFICLPQLASKCVVLVPRHYRSGYPASGPLQEHDDGYRGVFWYSAEDLETCNVLGEVRTRSQARRLHLQRLREGLNV